MKIKSSKKIVFFGALSLIGNGNSAYAASANQVQLEIIKNIQKVFSKSIFNFFGFSPNRTWPFTNIFINNKSDGVLTFHSYINILGIRELHILFKRINYIIFNRPDYIFLYNISFFEAIFFSLLKKIFKIKVVLFLQDVVQNNFIDYCLNFIKLKFVSHFDLLIPISQSIIDDFKLPKEKCILFQGGLTEIAYKLQQRCLNDKIDLIPKVVFAGRLEKYNGIDKVINYWLENDLSFELHIYGSGSYESQVIEKSKINSKIKFFGNVSDERVSIAQFNSSANLCLRYSIGLNENYFFPSKIYNLMSAPGLVIINNFNNLSKGMINNSLLLNNNLENLNLLLKKPISFDLEKYVKRIEWLDKKANWFNLLKDIKIKLN